MTFDHSGSRLITTDADKTIKIYKEDDTAVSFNIHLVSLHGCLIFIFHRLRRAILLTGALTFLREDDTNSEEVFVIFFFNSSILND